MVKGAPSVNPLGAAVTKRKAPGSDGVVALGGWLYQHEKNTKLSGASRWITYDNLHANIAIVAAAIQAWLTLGGSVKWKAQENPRGGADAARCAELVQEGLIDARMTKPWRAVVKRQLMKKFRGFALHAKGTRRDDQGRIVFAELAHRPQWTVERWDKPTETDPWTGIVQRTKLGKEMPIDRGDLFYSVEDGFTDSPDGIGLFRHMVETEKIYTRYRQLHGIGVDEDVNGIPLGRAPLSELARQAVEFGGVDKDDAAGIASYVNARTASMRDLMQNRVVGYGRSLLLDSLPYFTTETDGSSRPSGMYQFNYETIKSTIGAIPELRASLDDLNREFARVMCAEWLLMGDSEGARSVHDGKIDMFAAVINATLDDIADDATRDLSWWLTARNGYDPDKCAPTLTHEPVRTQSAMAAAEMLATLAKAGLMPDDEAINALRQREDLPPAPDVDPEDKLAPRGKPAPLEDDDPVDDDLDDQGGD